MVLKIKSDDAKNLYLGVEHQITFRGRVVGKIVPRIVTLREDDIADVQCEADLNTVILSLEFANGQFILSEKDGTKYDACRFEALVVE